MKKPLVIVEQDKEIKEIFADFDAALAPYQVRYESIIKEINDVKQKQWDRIQKLLLDRGLIDGLGVDLTVENGILYQGRSNGLGEMLFNAFKSTVDNGDDTDILEQ